MAKINFTDEYLDIIWRKAKPIEGEDSSHWREDVAGARICRECYGRTDDKLGYGWEVDHIKPISKDGKTTLANLMPLQWVNNRSKGDDYPYWKSLITSDGKDNICQVRSWREK